MTDMDDLTPEDYDEPISLVERTIRFKCPVCGRTVPITVRAVGRGREVYHICDPAGVVIGTRQGNDQVETFYNDVKQGKFKVRCAKCNCLP
jgi:predicted RNA-binding Zn-ribbon protein involved in translation (DUF1610 family)